MTFEEYLIANSWPNKRGPDHSLRTQMTDDGMTFYIHPANEGGDTRHFLAKGNSLLPNPAVITGDPKPLFSLEATVSEGGQLDLVTHALRGVGFERTREAMVRIREELDRILQAGPQACPYAPIIEAR